MKILNGTNTEVINSKGTLEIKSAGIKMVSDPFESSYVLFCVV